MHNFSTTDYQELTIDFRVYKSWNDKIIWANRLLNDFTSNKPPFFDYAMMGGDKFVRGYYLGRYRDNHLSTYQTEIQKKSFQKGLYFSVWWFVLYVFN